jgi:hypothetical protein
MIPTNALYRSFLKKQVDSSYNWGFFSGAIASWVAVTYIHNNRNKRHIIPQHTGDDCVYCKEYSQKKTSVLQ